MRPLALGEGSTPGGTFARVIGAAAGVAAFLIPGARNLSAQQPEFYFIYPQGSDPAAFTGTLVLESLPGRRLCFDLGGRSPTQFHRAVQLSLQTAVGEFSGTAAVDCNSAVIDTDDPHHPGNNVNIVSPLNCATLGRITFGYTSIPPPVDIQLSTTGNYLGELCYELSDDACGTLGIEFAAPCAAGTSTNCGLSLVTGPGSNVAVDANWSAVEIHVGAPNDDCVNAIPVDVGLLGATRTPYETGCALSELPEASCSAMQSAVWFEVAASCTGTVSIVVDPGADYVLYAADADCVPSPDDEIACNDATVSVEFGRRYLMRIGSNDGSRVQGALTMGCSVGTCRPGFPAGSPETIADCGFYSPCGDPYCEAGMCVLQPIVHGDSNRDGKADIFDILCVLDGFADVFEYCPLERVDLAPCAPDGQVDILDIMAVLDGYTGHGLCCG